MDEKRVMELVDRIASDAQMRERFAQDPVALFETSGMKLTPEDREALRGVKGLEGEELTQRISKCR